MGLFRSTVVSIHSRSRLGSRQGQVLTSVSTNLVVDERVSGGLLKHPSDERWFKYARSLQFGKDVGNVFHVVCLQED